MPPLQPNADPNPYASPVPPEGWLLPPSVPFDEYCNRRQSIHILWALVIFIGIPLVVTATALHMKVWNGRWTDPRGLTVLLVATGSTVAAQLVFGNFSYAYGPDVVQLLRGRFQAEGIDPDEWNGICVTFTPADRPRQFMKDAGSHPVFDAGFLFLFDDALMFLGEKTSFTLPRQNVRTIRPGTGTREIGRYPQRVYIDWVDDESQAVHTFNFGGTGAHSLHDSRTRVAPELLDNIRKWHNRLSRSLHGSPSIAALPPPDPALSATALSHFRSLYLMLSGFLSVSLFGGFVELGVAWLTSQPFTGCAALASLLGMCFLCSPMIFSTDPPA